MRRSAAGHDHSTQHLTDVRTRRVYASSGDGYAAIGWTYPGSTLLEVRTLRSDHGFTPAAYGDAPEAGGGAAAAAGRPPAAFRRLLRRMLPAAALLLCLAALAAARQSRRAAAGRTRRK